MLKIVVVLFKCTYLADDGVLDIAQYLTNSAFKCKSKYSPKVINNAQLYCRNMPSFQICWGSKMILGFVIYLNVNLRTISIKYTVDD